MDATVQMKPTVCIYHDEQVPVKAFQEFLYGMEEEGIPFTITAKSGYTSTVLAHSASLAAPIQVGVGITPSEVVLTIQLLPPMQFIYQLIDYTMYPDSLRNLGCNAARLVKGIPLKQDNRWEVSF